MENHRSKISDLSFISGMGEVTLVKFADDIKLGGKANALESWAAIQRDLGRVEEGGGDLVQFSMEKNPAPGLRQQGRLDMACLGSSSAEKALGVAGMKGSSIHHYSSTGTMEESDGSPLIQ